MLGISKFCLKPSCRLVQKLHVVRMYETRRGKAMMASMTMYLKPNQITLLFKAYSFKTFFTLYSFFNSSETGNCTKTIINLMGF